jgi:epoxyqueuosine reductase
MDLSAQMKEQLLNNPERFVRQKIKELVRSNPGNHLSFLNGYRMFDDPLVKFADGEDPIFAEYKTIVSPLHQTPREALARAYNKDPEEMPAWLSVISYILPISEETRKANRAETRVPSRLWSHTSWHGEKFNEQLRAVLAELLVSLGYLATAPGLPPHFHEYMGEKGLYSNWSERHIAYAAGHGTFSLSDDLITPRGIAMKCGSVVTSLVLPVSRSTRKSPYANCLRYLGVDCKACINRCPSGAITVNGHDKIKCMDYLNGMGYVPSQLEIDGYFNDITIAGCGLCQTKVPCEFRNPAEKLKIDQSKENETTSRN